LEQVSLVFTPTEEGSDSGDIDIEITGVWAETILYEVPLMSIVSEAYFKVVDTDWNTDGLGCMCFLQSAIFYEFTNIGRLNASGLVYLKGNIMYKAGVALSEFGTRRRRSFAVQNAVVWSLMNAKKQFIERNEEGGGTFAGTSNVRTAFN
jgi:nicotinate phosphoribosyltransferase